MEDTEYYFFYGYLLATLNMKKKTGMALWDVDVKSYKFSDIEIEEAFAQYVTSPQDKSTMAEAVKEFINSQDKKIAHTIAML